MQVNQVLEYINSVAIEKEINLFNRVITYRNTPASLVGGICISSEDFKLIRGSKEDRWILYKTQRSISVEKNFRDVTWVEDIFNLTEEEKFLLGEDFVFDPHSVSYTYPFKLTEEGLLVMEEE